MPFRLHSQSTDSKTGVNEEPSSHDVVLTEGKDTFVNLERYRTGVFETYTDGQAMEPVELKFDGEMSKEVEESNKDREKMEQNVEEIDQTSTPWYLRQDITSELLERKEIEIPEVPADSPPHVSELLSLLAKDLGIDELKLFDIRALDDNHDFKLSHHDLNYTIIGTGKSEKHIYKAATELKTFIKHTYNVVPSMQGMVSSAKTPAMRRRLLKKARKGPSATDNDYGFTANSWVLCVHDGVEIHLLSDQRRAELNLELIWCPPEDLPLYENKDTSFYESDNILHQFGRRGVRGLHTSSRQYFTPSQGKTTEFLTELLASLENLPMDASDEAIVHLHRQFLEAFEGTSPENYNVHTQFLKTIHLARPNLIAFEDVEESILLKYASALFWTKDASSEKIKDVTEYARLLVDSPEISRESKSDSDSSLDKLSGFISTLYKFSCDRFSMSTDPMFLPLLWKLTVSETNQLITSRDVTDIILGKMELFPSNGEPTSQLASNNARNVLCLAKYHDKNFDSHVSSDIEEEILFTYGNCGKWDLFWKQWNKTIFEHSFSAADRLDQWVRLAVFISMTGNKAQALKFLTEMWNNSSSVSGSFLDAFEMNGHSFNSKTQNEAVINAIHTMIERIENENEQLFDQVKVTLDHMANSQ